MRVGESFDINRLTLNTNKTQQLVLSTAHNERKGNGVQFLGVLDAGPAWKTHASNLSLKISENTYALRTSSFSLCTVALRIEYFALEILCAGMGSC